MSARGVQGRFALRKANSPRSLNRSGAECPRRDIRADWCSADGSGASLRPARSHTKQSAKLGLLHDLAHVLLLLKSVRPAFIILALGSISCGSYSHVAPLLDTASGSARVPLLTMPLDVIARAPRCGRSPDCARIRRDLCGHRSCVCARGVASHGFVGRSPTHERRRPTRRVDAAGRNHGNRR